MVRRLALLALLALGACATSQEKKTEGDLTQLLTWLPGSYATGAGAGITLNIVKVYAPRVGKHVFYAEESASNDANRVMSQRLLKFEIEEEHGAIVETVYNLVEPARWREGLTNTDLFTIIMPDEVRSVHGCQLLWLKTKELFSGVRSAKCHDSSGTTTAKAWLTDEALTLGLIEYKKQQ
ncbi:MAG TPA: CpcT/CpeT family chromophore lyase [Steroidobacteraceae bacterium]|jgi:hypothetical protein|nr:CpcT/CpeT family chromophore lyase [Steroidobacteraceae bacterium]